jgi:glycosyltransferase involved in cell wall biosynthesis
VTIPRILLLEPWHGGSHAGLVEFLQRRIAADWTVATMPARAWKWRMRGSALHFAGLDEVRAGAFDVVLATSYVALAELVGLVPSVARARRILYFHENQWAYPSDPMRGDDARDLHFGVTQLVSAAAADVVVFNSAFNKDSFLREARAWSAKMPDHRPTAWIDRIAERTDVLPPPIGADVAALPRRAPQRSAGREPLVVWNHRWEHDKAPEDLFRALDHAWCTGARFRLALVGARARTEPVAITAAEATWRPRSVAWGALGRAEYVALLRRADVVVSTARQEFLGLSVLEAVHAGAAPLVPDRLAYPELWPEACRYRDSEELAARLVAICRGAETGVTNECLRAVTERFVPDALVGRWAALLGADPTTE